MDDFGLRKRFVQFDGLRGWAALVVVCSHIRGLNLMPGQGVLDGDLIKVWDGGVAVMIFWIMSGFVLSRGIQYASLKQSGSLEKAPRKYILQAYLRRYPRLIIPAVVSCIWMYLLFVTGAIDFSLPSLPDSEWLKTSAFNFDKRPYDICNYSLWKAIGSGLTFIKIFIPGLNPELDMYNPVLWTMKGEILGSFILFALFLFHRNVIFLSCLVLFILGGVYQVEWLQSFMLGILLALFMVEYGEKRAFFGRCLAGSFVVLLAVWSVGWLDVRMLIAYAIVILVAFVSVFRSICSNRLSLFFGKVSFSVYLVHFGVLFSLGRFVSSLLIPSFGLLAAQWACLAVTIFLSCILGFYMEKYVDVPAIRFSKKLASSLYHWCFFMRRSEADRKETFRSLSLKKKR